MAFQNFLQIYLGVTEELKIAHIEHHMKLILTDLGLDLQDDSLRDTPARLAKMHVQDLFWDKSGVDIRGEGGQFLVAPSVHKSGNIYEWIYGNPLEYGTDDILD